MNDYTELQKAAQYAAQDTIKFADEEEEMRALHQFHEEAQPETVLALLAENKALRKDAERYRFVRNPIGTSSPLAIWNEGKMPLFSGMADAVVDEFMAKEASHG